MAAASMDQNFKEELGAIEQCTCTHTQRRFYLAS